MAALLLSLGNTTCPSDNSQNVEQGGFWNSTGIDWDAHRIGWAIAGGCSVLTVLISIVSVLQHAMNYRNRPEQRQIIRILYMPPVYAVISFLSYRFFREYTYYSLVEVVYEAITLSAFMLLLIEYVAATASGHNANLALERKDKRRLYFPLCCFRFRPTKPYFMHTIKWAVLQYVIFRPAVSIAGIVTQFYNVLCASDSFNIHFASVYLDSIDFVTISVALYGLIVFYGVTKEELRGRRPLAKFASIKLIVFFTFYQSFVFDALEGRVIKPTKYWTATNIADGLTALTTCIEMVFFSALMMWSFPATEYKSKTEGHTNIFRPLWDSINYADFVVEIWRSLKFFFNYALGRPNTRSPRKPGEAADFDDAFGLNKGGRGSEVGLRKGLYPEDEERETVTSAETPRVPSGDERARLSPYEYEQPGVRGSTTQLV